MCQPSTGETLADYSAESEINVRLIAAGHDGGLPKKYLGSDRFGGAYLCSLRLGLNAGLNIIDEIRTKRCGSFPASDRVFGGVIRITSEGERVRQRVGILRELQSAIQPVWYSLIRITR